MKHRIHHYELIYDNQNRVVTQTYIGKNSRSTIHDTYDEAANTVTRHSDDGTYTVDDYEEHGMVYYSATFRSEGQLRGDAP